MGMNYNNFHKDCLENAYISLPLSKSSFNSTFFPIKQYQPSVSKFNCAPPILHHQPNKMQQFYQRKSTLPHTPKTSLPHREQDPPLTLGPIKIDSTMNII